MRQCLTNPEGGYYTTKTQGRDQFGSKGDFITSPEISQVFGELLGLWVVAEWMTQGRKRSGVELVEVGPGRGTLMDDMLRALRNFKTFTSSIESVYLVEASKPLREKQKELLCGDAEPLEEIDIGWRSRSKYGGITVTWCEDIRFVPNDASKTPFIIAHEFFDALPIHAFQSQAPSPTQQSTIEGLNGPIPLNKPSSASRQPQWRELMVTPTHPPTAISTSSRPSLSSNSLNMPDFQLSLAKASTPTSLVLPETSQRYKALKSRPDSVIEISPESHSYVAEFAHRIGGANQSRGFQTTDSTSRTSKPSPSGGALIIDYGPSATIPTSTLRGIKAHKLVSPFVSPGEIDISADVDFTALAEAALNASEGVEVHGPIEQGDWLELMGMKERVEMLCKNASKSGTEGEETVKRIRSAATRLVEKGGGGMGRLYKFLAITPESGGRRPVGFGGELRM
ncbi:MAG: hypothetical protein MMC23_001914 [Stictis urceolatum]|nr:hypothetical protein [Stictis urceolata]